MMSISDIERDNQYCLYTLLPNGIHEFKSLGVSREAWDAYLNHQTRIVEQYANSPVLNFLYDGTIGSVSLQYVSRTSQEWLKQHPNRPFTRAAILYNDNVLFSLADLLIRSLRAKNTSIRFFRGDRREAAVAWLLEADSVKS